MDRVDTRVAQVCQRIIMALCVALALACRQNVDLPKPGTPEADVRRMLGEPSERVDQSRELIEQYVRGLNDCPSERVSRIARVWVYEKDSHQAVVVGIDINGTVLCAGHRGVTFVR